MASDTDKAVREYQQRLDGQAEEKKYPFLRALRWVLRLGAVLYLAVALMVWLGSPSGAHRKDETLLIWPDSKHSEEPSLMVVLVGLFGVTIRTIGLLAAAEAIDLGLELRKRLQPAK